MQIVFYEKEEKDIKSSIRSFMTIKHHKPYEKLAVIYDQLMDHVDYRTWSHYILNLIARANIKVHTAVDLACGTGNFLVHLCKSFPDLHGCDLSEAMIREARKKRELDKITIFINDARFIALQNTSMNAVLLLYDSLNYLTDVSMLNKTLSEIYRILTPGGLFIFDVVSEKHCSKYFADYHENEFWHQAGYSRHSFFDQKKSIQYNNFRIIINGITYLEQHIQKVYSTDFLVHSLQANSLEVVDIFEEFSFEKVKETTERMHFLCQKR
jgi:ubiquinone/menaquinone biosynthesis C-methylase UbiE